MQLTDMLSGLEYAKNLDYTSQMIAVVDLAFLASAPCLLGWKKAVAAAVVADVAIAYFGQKMNGEMPQIVGDAKDVASTLIGHGKEWAKDYLASNSTETSNTETSEL